MSAIQKELTRLKQELSAVQYTDGYATASPEQFKTHLRYNFLSALDKHGNDNAELYKLMLEQFDPDVSKQDPAQEYVVALRSDSGIVLLDGVPNDFIQQWRGKCKIFLREQSGVYSVVFMPL